MWGSAGVPRTRLAWISTRSSGFGHPEVHTLGEAPSKRTDHSVVLFRDSLLVFGGFDGHNRPGAKQGLEEEILVWKVVSLSGLVWSQCLVGFSSVPSMVSEHTARPEVEPKERWNGSQERF